MVLSDRQAPVSRDIPEDGVFFHEIWNTEGAPARINAAESSEPTERTLAVPPPARGTKIRINEFRPRLGQSRRDHREGGFVGIDGEFDPALAATLLGGLEGLMHGGPRD